MRLPHRAGRRPAHRSPRPAAPPPQPRQRLELVVWGAHGGAGTTTLATWLQPAWDMRAMRPESPYPAAVKLSHSRPLVVVCRNTVWGAQRAAEAVTTVTSQGGKVAVLAVVSDGWAEPATATHQFRLLEPRVRAVVRVPFVPALRHAAGPPSPRIPRWARRAVAKIAAAAGRTQPRR